jgi:hypothetical protein
MQPHRNVTAIDNTNTKGVFNMGAWLDKLVIDQDLAASVGFASLDANSMSIILPI